VHGAPDLQKIVAFENGLERALSIVRDEGASEAGGSTEDEVGGSGAGAGAGGIVVADALTLLITLLKNNPSNQARSLGPTHRQREAGPTATHTERERER
jgi:hypothetical protein